MVFAVQRTNRIPPPFIKWVTRLEATSLDVLEPLVDELGSLLDFLSVVPTQDRFDALWRNCRAMVLTQLSKDRISSGTTGRLDAMTSILSDADDCVDALC